MALRLWRSCGAAPRAGTNLDTLEHDVLMSECFRSTFSVVCPATGLSKWMKNLFLRLLLLYAVPDVKAAVMRLFEDDPEGYTKRLDTAFSVQNIVKELHYQHSDRRGCAGYQLATV